LFTLEYTSIAESDVVFIAVGTPPQPDGSADLSVVFSVAGEVGKHLKKYTVVITKSTVPVGTSEKVREIINQTKAAAVEFDYASVPEFLREGQAISDTFQPDRIVIGTDAKRAEAVMVQLHKPIATRGSTEVPMVLTNIPTAEMIKYASNAFLATKISFANAIAQLSEQVGADGPKVLESIGLDKRIGSSFLSAGAGYGGSCFPKDVKALIAIAKNYNYDFTLLKDVEEINKQAIYGIVTKTKRMLNEEVRGKTIGVLGLSFKPDTDDMRDAPSITVIKELVAAGANVQAYDPIATETAKAKFGGTTLTYLNDAYSVAKDADVLILMTEWNEFKELDLQKVKTMMKQPNLIDGRNVYTPEKAKAAGFNYLGVGR
jgi:UDPglucose 6-dehydrogenase